MYIAAKAQRWEQWEVFQLRFRHLNPERVVQYLVELSDFPPFMSWMTSTVKEVERIGHSVEEDVMQFT